MIGVSQPLSAASTQKSAPTTGGTVTITAFGGAEAFVLLNPAGTLASLTINMPTGQDGQTITIASTQIVTAVTHGGTINAPLTTLTANGYARYCYNSTTASWFRVG